MNRQTPPNLVWIDLEMSGLEPDNCVLLEIATIVTDSNLKILAEGPNIAIRHSETIYTSMDEWNTRHHNNSGLIARCRKSNYDTALAEEATIRFLIDYTDKGTSPLCGNSISQDRRFLYKYMPKLSEWLHYRSVDVTSFKEMCNRWRPDLPDFMKQDKHLALEDIRESIAEMEYYKNHFIKLKQ
ncbi:MAG: oligoribonuclease [Fibrobacter sp.]|nr:oligoribonuclease [Fibrobacter sp.]